MTIYAAADGSALGNPGPAGWAWYVDDDRWACGGWAHGTNNMGELMAVLDLLQQTAGVSERLHVYCDSVYAIKSITQWMPGWKKRGWKKGDGKPVLNLDLIKALDAAMLGRDVEFEWVKGHAGHEMNEKADQLANAAATSWRDGTPPAAGPGFGATTGSSRDSPTGVSAAEDDALFALDEERDELSDEEQVVALERSLLTADVRTDPAAVAALLAEDWREVGVSGRLWEREQLLAEIGPIGPAGLDVIDVRRLAQDLILLLSRTSSSHGAALRTSLWRRSAGQWRQLWHQGTPEG